MFPITGNFPTEMHPIPIFNNRVKKVSNAAAGMLLFKPKLSYDG